MILHSVWARSSTVDTYRLIAIFLFNPNLSFFKNYQIDFTTHNELQCTCTKKPSFNICRNYYEIYFFWSPQQHKVRNVFYQLMCVKCVIRQIPPAFTSVIHVCENEEILATQTLISSTFCVLLRGLIDDTNYKIGLQDIFYLRSGHKVSRQKGRGSWKYQAGFQVWLFELMLITKYKHWS